MTNQKKYDIINTSNKERGHSNDRTLKKMITCMETLSQLSPMELVDLVEAIEKEQKARKKAKCKEKLLAAMNAFSELYDYYDHLEIESEDGMMDIYLTDISEALEQLYALY